MIFGYLYTSFRDYCSTKRMAAAARPKERPEPPAACAACPYGRKKPCSAARQADCIYVTRTLPIWDGSF